MTGCDSERILKIGQYLTKSFAEYWGLLKQDRVLYVDANIS